jgi:hypothetical protein
MIITLHKSQFDSRKYLIFKRKTGWLPARKKRVNNYEQYSAALREIKI